MPAASPADIDAAVAAARYAFDETDWSRRPHAERGELCARLATAIANRSDELAELFIEETGSPSCSPGCTSGRPVGEPELLRTAGQSLPLRGSAGKRPVVASQRLVRRQHHPVRRQQPGLQESIGVVAAFTPYNFALACFGQKSAPALVAVLWLASDQARHVTGIVLPIDAGQLAKKAADGSGPGLARTHLDHR